MPGCDLHHRTEMGGRDTGAKGEGTAFRTSHGAELVWEAGRRCARGRGIRGWARGRVLLSPPPLKGNRGAVRAQGSNPHLMYHHLVTLPPPRQADLVLVSDPGEGAGGYQPLTQKLHNLTQLL